MTDNLPVSTANKGIDIADLIEYRKKGLTLEEIGRIKGCSHVNVSQRLKEVDLESLDNFEAYKDKVLEHTQREIVKSITPAKIEKLSAYQAVGAASLLQDKIMALRGQASEIIDHRHLVVDLGKAIDRLRQEQGIIDAEPVDS